MSIRDLTPEQFQERVQKKRQNRMKIYDDQCPEVRKLINEYGLTLVHAFATCGVTKHNHVRHLIECVLDEMSPTRGGKSIQGPNAKAARLMTEDHLKRTGGYE